MTSEELQFTSWRINLKAKFKSAVTFGVYSRMWKRLDLFAYERGALWSIWIRGGETDWRLK